MMNNLPLSDELKELALDYVLDNLNESKIIEVEKQMDENADFREEVKNLQIVEETMILNIPKIEPPNDLLDKIMKASFAD